MGAYENSQSSQRPKAGSIADGLGNDVDWSNSATTLSANWYAFTDNDTQLSYEYAVGSESEVDILIDNYALSFDGSDDYVSTGISSLDLGGATSLTIEFTIKINSGGKYQGIVGSLASNNAQFGVILQNNNWLQLSFYNSNGNWQDPVCNALGSISRGGTLSKYLLAKIR